MAVSTIGKLKRDEDKKNDSSGGKESDNSNKLFTHFLEREIDERRAASMNCRTITYGQDSKLHTFEYQTREYRY